ncbi:MAG: tetratricopeptide repeat protein [Desulfosoma sp.]
MPKSPFTGMPRPQLFRVHSAFPQAWTFLIGCLLLWTAAAAQELDDGQAAAQESNQASLLSVEKTTQSNLIAPRYPSVPFPPEPTTRERQRTLPDQPPSETASQAPTLDIHRTRLTLAWGYYNQGDYKKAAEIFQDLAHRETPPDVAEESRMGLAYALLRLDRLPEAARILKELVDRGIRRQETVPALVEVLLALKRYEDAEKYLPLLP